MFVDEAHIKVQAGKGGAGCLSFRREKNVPRGGPDGGDGGQGGSVFVVANSHLNTLVDFQRQMVYRAENGHPGGARNATGRNGQDLEIAVPLGTIISDADTREQIDEVIRPEQRVLVAKGGANGVGNTRFKSSTNRTPRKTIPGRDGEARSLSLQLRLLADVGLLGLPNAGKSSLIYKVTNAHPKIADYPFTTLTPSLGVVSMDYARSYSIADIPGLIEGASTGTGLGIQFLKHLQHTRLLFHIVDMSIAQSATQIAESVASIGNELAQFDETLAQRERWLVFNKIDLVPVVEQEDRIAAVLDASGWSGRWFAVSALRGTNCRKLTGSAMTWLEENPANRQHVDELEELLM